jgi:hypothetical protein
VIGTSFSIARTDAVVTAGSCFAQHVARYLSSHSFNFLVTEPLCPNFDAGACAVFNYGLFTARYGNVYTARQLRQLLERAYGLFEPLSVSWDLEGGRVVDPFRPQIQPGGFMCERELQLERISHFEAIRTAVETMDVFIFTLGLTEAWLDQRDGAVFPLAPGVAGGTYDPEIHAFHNFHVQQVVEDLQRSIDFIRAKNDRVRLIITVSPVPLNATAIDRHVLVSTTYSKAILRVAAEQICNQNQNCDYFPSYEIITAPHVRGAYYGEDCREVLPAGVEHVMGLFLKHYGAVEAGAPPAAKSGDRARQAHRIEALLETLCDEEAIAND